jgi:hypothetical protein
MRIKINKTIYQMENKEVDKKYATFYLVKRNTKKVLIKKLGIDNDYTLLGKDAAGRTTCTLPNIVEFIAGS